MRASDPSLRRRRRTSSPATQSRRPKDRKGSRNAIFYANEQQRRVAEAYIEQLGKARIFDAPIVTEVRPLQAFYEAEPYHQDYAERNPLAPYIVFHALPKVKKVRTYFADRVKQR